jgi:hypothetical protein
MTVIAPARAGAVISAALAADLLTDDQIARIIIGAKRRIDKNFGPRRVNMEIRNVRTTWMSILFAATIGLPAIIARPAVLVAGAFVAPQIALAQNAALMARLVALTRRKGYKDVPMGRTTCENLGLKPIGDCLVFQETYVDPYGITHGFSTFTGPSSGILRIFLFKHSRKRSYYYASGVDGKLQRAAVFDRKGTFAWSALPNDSAAVGYSEEVSYWRAKQSQLESEPVRRD